IIEVARTRILPFLNIGATGMISPDVGELEEARHIDAAAALRTIEAHRDLIRGTKVRLSRDLVGANAKVALATARAVSEAAGPPGARPGIPAGDDLVGPPRLQPPRPGLRPRDHPVEVPSPGSRARRGRPARDGRAGRGDPRGPGPRLPPAGSGGGRDPAPARR